MKLEKKTKASFIFETIIFYMNYMWPVSSQINLFSFENMFFLKKKKSFCHFRIVTNFHKCKTQTLVSTDLSLGWKENKEKLHLLFLYYFTTLLYNYNRLNYVSIAYSVLIFLAFLIVQGPRAINMYKITSDLIYIFNFLLKHYFCFFLSGSLPYSAHI